MGSINLGSNGTITNLAVGGLPDGTVDADSLASNSVANVKVADDAIGIAELSATGTASSSTFLRGDNAWAAPASGLSYADQWRINTGWTGGAEPLAANWERVDGAGQGTLGSAMAVDSSTGAWTFPATGIWGVSVVLNYEHDADVAYVQLELKITTNNSSYVDRAFGMGFIVDGDHAPMWGMCHAHSLVDVTDTSNVKVKFSLQNRINAAYQANTNYNMSYATFIRYGDT